MAHRIQTKRLGISDSVSSRVLSVLRKPASRRWGAFTLAELLVVIAILAILATVGFLSFSGYSGDAKDAAAKANVRSVLSAVRAESALTGNSPRRYVVHDASLSGASLSGAFVEFDGNRTYLTGGDWNAPGTNYSAGNPDWAALKLDPSKFRIASGDSRALAFLERAFPRVLAGYDPKSVLLGVAEAELPPSASGKPRTRSFLQGAAFLPSGSAYVVGDAPSFSSASGSSLGLVRDPSSPYLTGAVTDSASVALQDQGSPEQTPAPSSLANSLRFGGGAYLGRTPVSSGNSGKFTYSGWIKRGKLGIQHNLLTAFNGTVSNQTDDGILIWAGNNLQVWSKGGVLGSGGWYRTIPMLFRDPSAWYHVVVAIDLSLPQAQKVRIFVNGIEQTNFTDGGTFTAFSYLNTANPHRIGQDNSGGGPYYDDGYHSNVDFVDGQALDASAFGETDPASGSWKPKPYSGTYGSNGFHLGFGSGANLGKDTRAGNFGGNLRTSGAATGGFTAIGGLASAFDGVTVQNGGNAGTSAKSTAPSAGYTSASSLGRDWGAGVTKKITGFRIFGPADGGVVGMTAASANFKLQGSNDNSVWTDLTVPASMPGSNAAVVTVTSGIQTTAAYRYHRVVFEADGANNYYVAELELYEAGEYAMGSNDWTSNGLTSADSVADTPANNFATLNPLNPLNLLYGGYYAASPTAGNLKITGSSSPAGNSSLGTMAVSGKTYFEGQMNAVGAGTVQFGIRNLSTGVAYAYDNSGNKILAGTSSAYGSSFAANDFVGIAVDPAARTLEFFKNGVSQGVINSAFPSGDYLPFFYASNGSSSTANFGQGGMAGLTHYADAGGHFKYAPPSGFKALSTSNMPAPVIANPKQFFDVLAWTGDGNATKSIAGLPFQPDFVWMKSRSWTTDHSLHDSARGATKRLRSNQTFGENAEAMQSFDAGGFTVLGAGGASNVLNNNYVAWNWKKGALPGFDIVTYVGNGSNARQIPHSLSAAPAMYFTKNLDGYNSSQGFNDWSAYHKSFNQTGAAGTNGPWCAWLHSSAGTASGVGGIGGAPTSTYFYPNQQLYDNVLNKTYVAYLWSEVPGFSKFGSYVGTGNPEGPFVYTGFRPRWVMVKSSSAWVSGWVVYDTRRGASNGMRNSIYADSGVGESSSNLVFDILSNGFKFREAGGQGNDSGVTYVYAAFAEAPLGGQGVAPANAR